MVADTSFTTVSHKKRGNSAATKSKGKALKKVDALPSGSQANADPENAEDRDTLPQAMAEDVDEDELLVGPRQPLATEQEASGVTDMEVDEPAVSFKPVSKAAQADAESVAQGQLRRIPIPPHRMTPLKKDWSKIFVPLVEQAGLQVRMNLKRKAVEIKSSKHTPEVGLLQKAADFVKAFAMGFEADDAVALLRMDDLFVDTFEIKDVKTLHGDHLSRAIGRIAGKDGRTRFAIENASRTRVVVADTKIHILGSFQNIRIARDAIVSLIMGSPPGKVYNNVRSLYSFLTFSTRSSPFTDYDGRSIAQGC